MSGEQLHDFDLCLCRHALDAIRGHLSDPEIAAYVGDQLTGPVLAHLQALGENEEPPSLLLSDQELDDLSFIFTSGPFQFDQPWTPYSPLYRRGLDCVTEVRETLSREHAEHWAKLSAGLTQQLQSDRVYLGSGIEIVRQWVGEVRRLLRSMGRTDLLPAPEGAFPTPACPEPPTPSTRCRVQTEVRNNDSLLAAVAETQSLQREVRDLLLSQKTVKDFYTSAEVAELLGKAEFTVREWCRNGRIHAQKQGSGRGKHQFWVISHGELQRVQKEGLLPVGQSK